MKTICVSLGLFCLMSFGQKAPQQKGDSYGLFSFYIGHVQGVSEYTKLNLEGKTPPVPESYYDFKIPRLQYSYNYMAWQKVSLGLMLGYYRVHNRIYNFNYNKLQFGGVIRYFPVNTSSAYIGLQLYKNFTTDTSRFKNRFGMSFDLGLPIAKLKKFSINLFIRVLRDKFLTMRTPMSLLPIYNLPRYTSRRVTGNIGISIKFKQKTMKWVSKIAGEKKPSGLPMRD